MGRIEDLGLVADKGLEWKARAESAEKELAHQRRITDAVKANCSRSVDERDAALLRATQAEQELKDLKEWWNLNPNLFQRKLAELTSQVTRLREAGDALVRRWDTPGWKDVPHTAVFIDALRAVIAETPGQSLAKHDAEVLRTAADECEEVMPGDLPHITQSRLLEMADRLEQQAAGTKLALGLRRDQ